jgi:hypothetical protein
MNIKNNFWKSSFKEWTVLEPTDRLSEVLFGLIMVLAFTGTISASTAGKQEVRELVWAALGCNLAWGIVDAIMNFMDTIIGRARDITQMNKIRESASMVASREIVRDSISPLLSDLMNNDEIDRLSVKIKQLPEPKFTERKGFFDRRANLFTGLSQHFSRSPSIYPF